MIIIHLEKVTANHAGREIFRDLSMDIDERARIGLVGPNGSGKSTLLRLIAGELALAGGSVTRIPGPGGRARSVGYLPQDLALPPGLTLLEAALVPPPDLAEIEAALGTVEAQLADPALAADLGRMGRVLERQAALLDEYDRLGGPRHAGRVRAALSALGVEPQATGLAVEHLSGGQKKLAALARLAAAQPDLLLLDEPDNHLDLDARRALEAFIRAYPGAVLIVSHDRYLLDEVVTHIAELEAGRLAVYPGSYSRYAAERDLRRMRQQQLYTSQQKEITRIEAAIKRFEHWAHITEDPRHIRQARHRRRMLERMEESGDLVEAVRDARRMDLQIGGWRGSTEVVRLEHVTLGFDDDLLLLDQSLLIRHGERVGLIGPNGAGKSVLFRALRGEVEPLEGRAVIGPSVTVGYYAQEHQTLAGWLQRTPLELLRASWPRSEGDCIAFLVKFLFNYEQAGQPIHTLSGGERSRLQLALLVLQNPNLLLLDEPTNNLDIPSAEVLEAALEDFEGAVFVISHDRYFLDRVVDRVLVMEDGALLPFEGGYSDVLERKQQG